MRVFSLAAKLLGSFVAVTLAIVSCSRTQLPGEHQGTTGVGGAKCAADGKSCGGNSDCCNSDCTDGTCNPPNCGKQGEGCDSGCCGGLSCAEGVCETAECYPPQNICFHDSSCCSGICGPSGTCEAACQNKGTKCTKSLQCCGNDCEAGICIDPTA